jgi:hypothetical protein
LVSVNSICQKHESFTFINVFKLFISILGVMSVGFLLDSVSDAVIWRGPRKNGTPGGIGMEEEEILTFLWLAGLDLQGKGVGGEKEKNILGLKIG